MTIKWYTNLECVRVCVCVSVCACVCVCIYTYFIKLETIYGITRDVTLPSYPLSLPDILFYIHSLQYAFIPFAHLWCKYDNPN